jgi:hypothetical protein
VNAVKPRLENSNRKKVNKIRDEVIKALADWILRVTKEATPAEMEALPRVTEIYLRYGERAVYKSLLGKD